MQNKKQKQLQKLELINNTAKAAESASLGLSFGGLFGEYLHSPVGNALTGVGSQVLYPILIAAAAVEAVLAWVKVGVDRRRQDNKVKTRNVVNASISTVAFAGFTTALIGLLAAASMFSLPAPVIFMSIIGGRTLYNVGAGIYYKNRAGKMDDPAKQAKHNERAKEHFKNAAFGLVAFAAVTAVFLLGYLVVAPLGMALNATLFVLSVVGIGLGIKKHFQQNKQQPLLQEEAAVPAPTPVSPKSKRVAKRSHSFTSGFTMFENEDKNAVSAKPQSWQSNSVKDSQVAGRRLH